MGWGGEARAAQGKGRGRRNGKAEPDVSTLFFLMDGFRFVQTDVAALF
jgi:hypothetical protein